MAQLQSAFLTLLQVLRDTDENDMIRRLLCSALQVLFDAEATAFIGADKHQRPASVGPSAMAPASSSRPLPGI